MLCAYSQILIQEVRVLFVKIFASTEPPPNPFIWNIILNQIVDRFNCNILYFENNRTYLCSSRGKQKNLSPGCDRVFAAGAKRTNSSFSFGFLQYLHVDHLLKWFQLMSLYGSCMTTRLHVVRSWERVGFVLINQLLFYCVTFAYPRLKTATLNNSSHSLNPIF